MRYGYCFFIYRIEVPEGTDPDLADLLHKILEKDPSKRITMPKLRVCLLLNCKRKKKQKIF